jgi:predicted phosphoadenosine phosphosulfate sulfurtransferase
MTELTVVEQESEWHRLKRLVLDAVSSPITRRVYNLALDEFIEWYDKEGRCGFYEVDGERVEIVTRE